ncbi:MAG: polysaccharide deacetylase family protein [Bacillota bacterium]|nr:polysaccharide deacetylase family protein [Bacillota bacterium]
MKRYIIIFLLSLLIAACQNTYSLPETPSESGGNQPAIITEPDDGTDTQTEVPDGTTDSEQPSGPDLQDVRPNEAGGVMILMYHEVGGVEAEWTRSVDNFRADLETLYQNGYRPVHLRDFLRGNIDIPAGTSPFILTFDDGTAGQFRFSEVDGEWKLDPDCAVAVLLQMAEKYDDFTPAGTFYINYPLPFRQKNHIASKLELLVNWGFEIGNHAYNHENLRKISRDEAVKALAKHVKSTREILPGYKVNTLALPYGARPKDDSHLARGEWGDTTYENLAILLVGANPAPSPFHQNFNPLSLPRVRADGTELYRWLDYYKTNPHLRYISDGDPTTVTVPAENAELIDPLRLGDHTLQTY